jgi:hypothetical protein
MSLSEKFSFIRRPDREELNADSGYPGGVSQLYSWVSKLPTEKVPGR